MSVITAADLKRFAPKAAPRVVAAFVAHADAAFARWQITSVARLRMFMAHVDVESGHLTVLFENMHYTGARLWAVYGKAHFASLADAVAVAAKGEEAIANRVYGGRMGNVGPDDGWLDRGQGLLDTTGMDNFKALAKHMGLSVDETRARLTSDDGMVDCAAATFQMLGCLPFADKGDLIGCTRKVNGGLNGLTDRRLALASATKVWPTMRALQPAAAAASSVAPAAAAATPAVPSSIASAPAPAAAAAPPPSLLTQICTTFLGPAV